MKQNLRALTHTHMRPKRIYKPSPTRFPTAPQNEFTKSANPHPYNWSKNPYS